MKYDIVLIQPKLFKSLVVSENTKIEFDYWNTMEKYAGKLLGDLPTEASNGILSIASYLESNGYNVKVLDFHLLDFVERRNNGTSLSLKKIFKLLDSYQAKFWGFSMMTISEENCYTIVNELRKKYPDIYIFAGGYYPTHNCKQVLCRNKNIDFIVKNEGEFTIKNILDEYYMKRFISWEKYGLAYREGEEIREPVENNGFVIDINLLPPLNYHLYDEELLDLIIPRVYTARGCENNCIYCTANNASNKVYRKRTVNQIVDEIEKLDREYHKKFFVMGDLEFLSDVDHAQAVCREIIKRKLNIKWWCQIYPLNANSDSLKLMNEAGCIQVALGIESNNEKSLELLNKGACTEKSVKACKLIKENGMQVQAYLILGLPNDTVDSMISLTKFVGELINRNFIDVTHLSVMVPYPGSAIFENRDKFHIAITQYNANKFYMNCDFLGAGIPPYNLAEVDGTEIYSLWLFALSYFTRCYRSKKDYLKEFEQLYCELGLNKISILDKYNSVFER